MKNIFFYISIWFLLVISVFFGWPIFFVYIVLYAFLFSIVFFLFSRIILFSFFIKRKISFSRFTEKFVFIFLIAVNIFLVVFSFIVYDTVKNKNAPLYRYELTNGEKKIIFQEMSHIATEDFYTTIREDIQKNSWYTLYYEWVQADENEEILYDFQEKLGMQLTDETYGLIAELFHISAQDNKKFLGLTDFEDKNVDITLTEIMNAWRGVDLEENAKPIEIDNELRRIILSLNARQKQTLRYLGLFFMNTFQKNMDVDMVKNMDPRFSEVLDNILTKRDKHLVEEVLNSEEKNIYIIYGAYHFPGFFQGLQKTDESWEIKKISKRYPYIVKDI